MNCLICHSESEYFFSKLYTEKPFDEMMHDIGEVEYYKCINCGFTFSKTHFELSAERWEKLNFDFHQYLENISHTETNINQPPYIEQALMIKILNDNEIIKFNNNLDYGGGYGTLSTILKKYFNLELAIYDPYVQNNKDHEYISKDNLKKYDTVLSSALFEHLTSRNAFDEINNCVSEGGALMIHTRISGFIPKDPNWFYLNPPVHCAFHTNKSMEILMKQWNYESSIYCLAARCWVLLKKDSQYIESKVKKINKELQNDYLFYKKGFVDFWPGN